MAGLPGWDSKWDLNAKAILAGTPHAEEIRQTLRACHRRAASTGWLGACHALSAINHILLLEQDVPNRLVVGEAERLGSFFDHSWVECDGEVVDAAIAFPLDQRFAAPPVLLGRSVATRLPAPLIYGTHSGHPSDPNRLMVEQTPFMAYMDGFPGHPHGLWGVAAEVAADAKIRTTAARLRETYGSRGRFEAA